MKNGSKGKLAGFTLVELLVVVLIIGLLAAAAVAQYQKVASKARVNTYLPILQAFADAEERYYMSNGTYPPSSSDLEELYSYLDITLPAVLTKDHMAFNPISLTNTPYYSSVLIRFKLTDTSNSVSLVKMLGGSENYGSLSNEIDCMGTEGLGRETCSAVCGHSTIGRVFFYDEYGCLLGNGNPEAYPRGSFLQIDPAYK